VLVSGRVGELPQGVTGGGVEALHDFLVADTVEQDEAVACHHGTAVAGADLFPPHDRGAILRPGSSQAGFGRGTIAGGTAELRPVGCPGPGQQAYTQAAKGDRQAQVASHDRSFSQQMPADGANPAGSLPRSPGAGQPGAIAIACVSFGPLYNERS